MRLTILGSGTSQGVPTIGCRCEVCRSEDQRDMRLRCSAMVEWRGLTIVIDAGPDFRCQMLREGVRHIEALLLTHSHKDHTGGIDDTRAFTFVDYPKIFRLPIYALPQTLDSVRHDYYYAFKRDKYIGVPEVDLHEVEEGGSFEVSSEDGERRVEVEAIRGFHAEGFCVTGYRFGEMAYLTDFKSIEPSQEERLYGLKVLVVNGLRWRAHHSHFSIEEALALIDRVKPEMAYITHLSHEVGLYDDAMRRLPAGVALAYDGLKIEI